jgi:Putative polyhydroxyalkanoic acid system protein (PHA_gran_rgn)
MRIAVLHNTTKSNARAIVERKAQQLLAQFGDKADDVQHEWRDDTLHIKGKARGMSVEATLEVTDAAVVVDGKLPLLARPFESRIRQAVERELESLFKTA